MKIAIADNTSFKFCRDLKEHWESRGHEVKTEPGASEYLAQWADIYYIDFSDNNIHYLWKLYTGVEGVSRTPDWDNNKKPKIVCRAIDWDVWIGFARSQDIVDFADQWVCIAPHIEKKLRAEAKYKKNQLKLIRPGVNLERFTPKFVKTDGFQLGMVLGDMWWPKNHMAGLDIFYQLYKQDNRWRLHLRGQHEPGEYWPVMYDHFLDSRGIRDVVRLDSFVPDMNEWYEGIDVLLHPGMKETFCYAVGEAAAKGIPVVVNDFFGSEEIWPKDWLYKDHTEALEKINQHRTNSPNEDFRNYIKEHYSLERMCNEFDSLLGL